MKNYPRKLSFWSFLVLTAIIVPLSWSQNNRTTVRQQRMQRNVQGKNTRQQVGQNAQTSFGHYSMPRYLNIQKALGITEEQWKTIEPHFERLQDLRSQANVLIYPKLDRIGGRMMGGLPQFQMGDKRGQIGGSVGGSSFINTRQNTSTSNPDPCEIIEEFHETTYEEPDINPNDWQWHWVQPSLHKETLTPGEQACEDLLGVLEDPNSDPAIIAVKVAALEAIRQAIQDQIPQAQEALRNVLNERQQAIMTLMGYL